MSKSNSRMAFCAGLLSLAATAADAQAIFTTGPEAGDQIFVNQNTGAIYACQAVTAGTAAAPTPDGVCKKIGAAAPSATNPSLIVSIPVSNGFTGGFTFLVTNVYTGKVTQCEYYYQSSSRSFYGDCDGIVTLP